MSKYSLIKLVCTQYFILLPCNLYDGAQPEASSGEEKNIDLS